MRRSRSSVTFDSWGADDIPDVSGRRFVITGGSSGIGLEAARLLAARGGDVLITSRSTLRGAKARESLLADGPRGGVEVAHLDLADLTSVRTFADTVLADPRGVDVLINNAGVMMVPEGRTVDGFETQLGTNHLGHFALTGLLLPALLAADAPRVVTVSSLAHNAGSIDFDDLVSERGYSRIGAYARSKLANLLFTMELQRRFDRAGVDATSVACHPGMSSTNLSSGITGGWWERAVRVSNRFEDRIAQSAADGALPTVRAATDPDANGGDYYGPDGFQELRGRATKVKARPKAYDVHDARALWEMSIELTGVDFAELDRRPEPDRPGPNAD